MFRILCLVLIATEVLTSDFELLDQNYYDLNRADEIFDQYIRKYGKKYQNDNDYRFKVFKENLRKINEWNKESDSNVYGINEFTDMSFEEFSKYYLGFNSNFTTDNVIEYKPSGVKAPESLDWRSYGYVTEVKNQGQCGSCFAFSAIGNIEGQYAKTHGTTAFSLSAQQGLDCDTGSCEGGIVHGVFQTLAAQGGSMRDEDYPYETAKRQCRTDKSKIAVKVTGGSQLGINSEDSLKDAVANYGPLAIAICVNDQVKNLQNGQIFTPTTPCYQVNHAVLLVGYGNDGSKNYWIIKNSWGYSFGEQGYFRLIMGQKALSIGEYVASATVA